MKLPVALKKKMAARSRAGKEAHFYKLCPPGMRVLDVGVSPETGKQGIPARNHFLKNFRDAPALYTGLGIDDLNGMDALFPGKRFVQYPGRDFPFADGEFDWVHSNAVLEHVGREEAQLHFINEMLRVSRNVFFNTPSKFFPVESHTNWLFVHWHEALFFGLCRRFRPNLRPDNLRLVSKGDLERLLKRSTARRFEIHSNRVLGFTMNFTVVCSAYDE